MWGNIFSGLLSVAQGDSPEEILKKQAMATITGGTAPVGVESASTIAPHLAQTGAEQAIASGMGGELGSQLGGEAFAGVSGVNNSVMQNPDFIGTHLTDDFNSQMLANNTTGTFTDGVPDPLQAYPSFDNPVASTAEELANADGGYGGSIFDGLGEYGKKVNDFTGMENKDWTMLGLQGGASALSAPPPKRPQPAPMGQGISKPQGNPASKPPSLLSSNPTASQAGGQQLTPEQIMKLKQQGII